MIQQLTGNLEEGTTTGGKAAATYTQQVARIVSAKNSIKLTKPMTHKELFPSS